MGYTIAKGNYQSFFWVYNFLNKFQFPRCLMHVWCYRSHNVLHAGFRALKVVDLNLVDNVLQITPQEKIEWVLI
jgi:hypothetical protein